PVCGEWDIGPLVLVRKVERYDDPFGSGGVGSYAPAVVDDEAPLAVNAVAALIQVDLAIVVWPGVKTTGAQGGPNGSDTGEMGIQRIETLADIVVKLCPVEWARRVCATGIVIRQRLVLSPFLPVVQHHGASCCEQREH